MTRPGSIAPEAAAILRERRGLDYSDYRPQLLDRAWQISLERSADAGGSPFVAWPGTPGSSGLVRRGRAP